VTPDAAPPDGSPRDVQAEFHAGLRAKNLAALWVARRGVDLTKPRSPATAAIWRYRDIRADIAHGGDIVSAEDAFRRVLVLENPAYPGENRVTNTLYAGLQLVKSGEIAPCHRHSQTAIRFVVEGQGAYTKVGGEMTTLHRGDFVVTPQWSWHDHGNDGAEPVVWLDVLDTPIVGFIETVFREPYPARLYPVERPEGDAPARFGSGMAPMGWKPEHAASPVFSYPYARARAALSTLGRASRWDACHGVKMQYVNPTTGGAATPTIGAYLQLLPQGFAGADYRSTDAAVYCVAEGTGRTVIEGETFEWRPSDVLVVPGWRRHRHVADTEAVLFSASDRPVQETLALWREERADRN
jgi:gentisate 1,2-dioxygenase